MIIEEAISYHLMHDAGVIAIASTRGFPLMVPPNESLPAWAFQVIDGDRDHTHDGPSGLRMVRVQITCIGNKYLEAVALGNAVAASLNGYKGQMGGAGGLMVSPALVVDESDGYGGSLEPLFEQKVRRLDVMVWYQT